MPDSFFPILSVQTVCSTPSLRISHPRDLNSSGHWALVGERSRTKPKCRIHFFSVQTEHAPSLRIHPLCTDAINRVSTTTQIINFQIFRFSSSPLGWALRSGCSIRCCKYKNNPTNRKCFKTCICAKKDVGEHKILIFKRKHLMHKTGFNIFRLKCFLILFWNGDLNHDFLHITL